jgi:hypothetical protein
MTSLKSKTLRLHFQAHRLVRCGSVASAPDELRLSGQVGQSSAPTLHHSFLVEGRDDQFMRLLRVGVPKDGLVALPR